MEKRKSTVNPSICLEKRISLVSICCWLNRKPPAMRQNAWKRGMLEPLYLNLMRRSSHKPLAIYRKTGNYDYFPIFSFAFFFFLTFFFSFCFHFCSMPVDQVLWRKTKVIGWNCSMIRFRYLHLHFDIFVFYFFFYVFFFLSGTAWHET